jgi:hypothetical protein
MLEEAYQLEGSVEEVNQWDSFPWPQYNSANEEWDIGWTVCP